MKITHKGKTPWEGHEATCLACGTVAIMETDDQPTFQRPMPGYVVYQFWCPVCRQPELAMTVEVATDREA